MQAIATKSAPAAIGPYSQAVRSAGFVFLSGQIAIDPGTGALIEGDVRAEAERVMKNLEAVLGAAGLAFHHVVKTTIYLVDMADFAVVNEVYGKRFDRVLPARATVQVAGLPKGARVEIDAIASTPQLP
jgi:2-iminobutanoate/2-iminopropanoate deaminase